MSKANRPDRLRSLLSWTHCLRGSLQPQGSFDHYGINSVRSSGTEWSATEIVRSGFLSGCRERSGKLMGAVHHLMERMILIIGSKK